MNLLFVKNEQEATQILSDERASAGECIVIPIMPKAALALTVDHCKPAELPIALLSRAEIESIRERAVHLSKTWHRSLLKKVDFRGIDLLDCCRLQMMGFFEDVVASEIMVTRLIAKYKPEKATFFRYPSVPSYGNAMHDGSADIFEAVCQHRLAQHGVRVEVLAPEPKREDIVPPSVPQRLTGAITGKLRGIKRKVLGTSRVGWSSYRIALEELPSATKLLVGYGTGYDLLVIWPYLDAAARETGYFPVALNGLPTFDASTARSGLRLSPEFQYVYTGDIAPDAAGAPDLSSLRGRCLDALSGSDVLPEMLRNPKLTFQFELLWDKLAHAALDAAARAVPFFERFSTALYLDDYCGGPENRTWAAAANEAGVPSVNVSHGAVGLIEFFEFNTRWALAWGELCRQNIAMAVPDRGDSVIVAGDPSMERLMHELSNTSETERNTIMLATGGFLHQAWTDIHLDRFLTTWNGIAELAERQPSLSFTVKPHPSVRDLGPWYREFSARKGLSNLSVIDDRKLEELMGSACLTVLVGKPGTAGMVSILAGVPVVFLDCMLCRDVPGYRIWNAENGVPRLTSVRELENFVERIVRYPEERDRVLALNKQFHRLYLQPFDMASVCRHIGIR